MPIYTDPDEAFRARYRKFLAREFDQFEFFGVDPLGVRRRQPFQRGYATPTLMPAGSEGTGLPADIALAPLLATPTWGPAGSEKTAPQRRVLVRGPAGSGKTTLLRWLGWQAASTIDDFGTAAVPFLVELGRYVGAPLPRLEDLVIERLRHRMPEGWVSESLASGRVLLLLDGLDEVPVDERDKVETWLRTHLNLGENVRCVVSTRPSVVAERWWADERFQRYDLLPMTRYTTEQFVREWHRAAMDNYPADTAADRDAREWLRDCETDLIGSLAKRPALRGLSDNPLLCGLLCALHRDGGHLPENRKGVYDAALHLLMVRWPSLRRRRRYTEETAGRTGDPGPRVDLDPEELQKLLQRIAFWMVCNQKPVLTYEEAPERVRSGMAGLRADDPDRVLHYLAHESGMLRELADRSLQFLHRTFRDHLAAKEVIDDNNIRLMLNCVGQTHWHDVVVMAGAHARPRERADILRELIGRAVDEPTDRQVFVLLAHSILEQAPVLPETEPEVRDLVRGAVRDLIPPQTADAADKLADVGPLVLDLLPDPHDLDAEERILTVRTVAGIAAGPDPADAVEWMLWCLRSPRRDLVRAMLNVPLMVWDRRGDHETYAREVLSKISFADYLVSVRNAHRIEHIGHLSSLTNLELLESFGTMRPVAALPALRWLRLIRNIHVDLRPLTASRMLRTLNLVACSAVAGPIDLSPVARMPLRRLVVSGFPADADLASLAGARLVSLHLRGNVLRRDVVLPSGLEVRHLTVVGRGHVDFSAVRGVRSLIINREPAQHEIDALPDLRRLVVVDSDGHPLRWRSV